MKAITNQTFAKEVVDFLKFNKEKTFLFYPSAGRDENENQWRNCPTDYVILCDKEAGKDTINGKVISIKTDNNYALRLIYLSGIRVSIILGKQCGVFEGGARESFNSLMWLGRLLPILTTEFYYITSHLGRMEYSKNFHEGQVKLLRNFEYPDWLSDIPNTRSHVKKYIVQKLAKTFHPEYTVDIGERKITIQRKSIWEDTDQLDGFFTSIHCKTAMEYFLPQDLKQKNRFIQDFKDGNSILPVLQEAERMKWSTIGLTPFANGNYSQFLNDLKDWDGQYPKIIKLYHLEKKCFGMIYAFSNCIPKNDRCPDCNGNGCPNCFGFGVLMDYDDLP